MTKTTTMIGRLSEVCGSGMTATLTVDIENGFPVLLVGGEAVRVGQVGSYVRIKDRDIQIVALVTSASEDEKEIQAVSESGGDSNIARTIRKGYISLMPVGEIDQAGKFERGLG